MPSMTPMMSLILRELWLISSMVETTLDTTSPPRAATEAAVLASWLAVLAASADWCTVALSCSMALAVDCRWVAVSSVRWLRSALPEAISPVAVAMWSATWRTSSRVPSSAVRMLDRACSSSPVSSPLWAWTTWPDRSMLAILWATSRASCSGRVMLSEMRQPNSAASRMEPAHSAVSKVVAWVLAERMRSPASSRRWRCRDSNSLILPSVAVDTGRYLSLNICSAPAASPAALSLLISSRTDRKTLRCSPISANNCLSLSSTSRSLICCCCTLDCLLPSIAIALNSVARVGSLLFTVAVVRCTALVKLRYQSLAMRSMASDWSNMVFISCVMARSLKMP